MEEKGGPDKIYDMTFTKAEGAYDLWSAGKKHFCHWSIDERKKRKGIYQDNGPQSSMCSCAADNTGKCYSGAANSGIYVWEGRSLLSVAYLHDKGFVGTMTWQNGKLYTGGKDGKVNIINCESMVAENSIEFNCLPRALDVLNGEKMIVGLRDGNIVECDLGGGDQTILMQSHNDGETWGLALDGTYAYSSGDDNQVK